MSAAGLITRYYDAFNAGDMDAMLGLLHEDVAHDINQGRREVGRHAFGHFMERMNRLSRFQFLFQRLDGPHRHVSPQGLHGLAGGQGRVAARAERKEDPERLLQVLDGLIRRVTNYYNLEHWLQQVRS